MSNQEIQMIFQKNLNRYLEETNSTQAELATFLGVSNTTVNKWVRGYGAPRMDKVDKICEFFGIRRSDLLEEKSKSNGGYYDDPEVAEIANRIHKDPKLRILMSANSNLSQEDLQIVIDLTKNLLRREGHEVD